MEYVSAQQELSKSKFGDKRLGDRLGTLAKALCDHPGESFPDAVGSIASLEATYRFFGNSKVSPGAILAPHIEATIQRSCAAERIVVSHDTTTFTFSGNSRREGLGWVTSDNRVHQGRQSFLAHFSLAVSRSATVSPLGSLGFSSFVRTGTPKGKTTLRNKKQTVNELDRWGESVERVENLFPATVRPIHVMDREADDYQLFSDLSSRKARFVVRIRQNRRGCKVTDDTGEEKLFSIMDKLEVRCERTVAISKRAAGTIRFPKNRTTNIPRNGRVARLQICASTVVLPRTRFSPKHLPNQVALNCIHVREIGAPDQTEPVDWKLLTQEPIETAEDILNCVDDYRARWMIEEFFKALKTGCVFEKRQLESKHSLLNALAVFTPIACQLLTLRTLDREHPNLPATRALTKNQTAILVATSKASLDANPTIGQAFTAIAALGGHIPNNGKPGWIVLARGMEKLLIMEVAWAAAKRCDQS